MINLKVKTLALFFCGLLLLFMLLFVGLNLAERGLAQLFLDDKQGQALSLATGGKTLIITFAGRDYHLPYLLYWR